MTKWEKWIAGQDRREILCEAMKDCEKCILLPACEKYPTATKENYGAFCEECDRILDEEAD